MAHASLSLFRRHLLFFCLVAACSTADPAPTDTGDPSDKAGDDAAGDTADGPTGSGKPKDAGGSGTPPRDAGVKLDSGTPRPLDAGHASAAPDTGSARGERGERGEPTSDAGPSAADATASPASTFPAVSDPIAKGPYTAKTVESAGPNKNYTIYQPTELGKDGVKHPVLTWGNGGSTMPSWYPMLPHLATHGFVVVAANTVPSIGAEEALGKDMLGGLDWILQENERAGSDYAGKLDPARVAPFGYSMGGLATFTIVGDPRWVTTVHISGGNMGDGVRRVDKMHVPAMFLCGENDIAGPQCETDFAALTTQSVFYGTMMGEDHLGILAGEWVDRIRGTVTAWMRWKLMDDETFESRFAGPDCALCKDSNYTVKKKNFE